MFSSAIPVRRRGWLPWAGSLAAHAVAVALITAIANLASWVTYDTLDASGYLDPLRLRTAFYYIPDKPPAPEIERSQPRRAEAPPRLLAASLPDPPPPDPPKLVIPRQFELPPVPAPARKAPVMLQPEVRLKAVQQQTPALAFWARENNIPRPHKEFVAPGRVEVPAAQPKLTAPPVLKVPNRETRLADINLASSIPPVSPPALPVAPSATSPLRTDREWESLAAALDVAAGQGGVNVISLGSKLPAGELLTIPGGLVNAPLADARAPGTGSSDRSTPTGPPNGNAAGAPNGSNRAAEGSLPLIRIEHPPGGKFDAVIMQSAARDDLAAAGGVLNGNPVYTVYLDVGDRKEWLLEFCAPSAPKRASNPYEVFVDAPAILGAPYPLLTVIPGGIVQTPRSKYMVMHGFLTAAGSFRDMAAPESKAPLAHLVLPNLGQWRFRPATRDGQPVEVEVLLVIPPES